MIIYEIALKPKEAGFPQKRSISWVCTDTCDYYCEKCGATIKNQTKTPEEFADGYHKDCSMVDIPNLSELIEACGDNLYSMYRHRNEWQAHSNSDQWDTIISHGSTPEEAVANLWLELNKK